MDAETRITIDEFRAVAYGKLIKHGVGEAEAALVADIFARNAADGVISHSVLRFARLISNIDTGMVIPGNMPSLSSAFNAVERYEANSASGVVSASFCMNRACDLARNFGIGMVALAHANHWMRGGYYGHLAADRGMAAICWTNTIPNMPSWGSRVPNIGNNPFVMAVPDKDGRHLVLDSAMAQFSNGKLEVTRREGKSLPVYGGYDRDGNLTMVPGDIEETHRTLPVGFWKGSSMSILLDSMAALLSDGFDTAEVGRYAKAHGIGECGVSQVFIAIDPRTLGPNDFGKMEASIRENVRDAEPVEEGRPSRCPGDRVYEEREKAYREGIVISSEAWDAIKAL